jgi:hypothetical protein
LLRYSIWSEQSTAQSAGVRDGGNVNKDNREKGKGWATEGQGGHTDQQTSTSGNVNSNTNTNNKVKEKGGATEEEGGGGQQMETDGKDPENLAAEDSYNKTAGFSVILPT